MEDFKIEPPKAPKQNASPIDGSRPVPLPPQKQGILQKLFGKATPEPTTVKPTQNEALPQPVDNMPGDEPPDLTSLHDEALGHDEIVPPPQLDEFNQAHAEELSKLKEKLGIEEFVIPDLPSEPAPLAEDQEGLFSVFNKAGKATKKPTVKDALFLKQDPAMQGSAREEIERSVADAERLQAMIATPGQQTNRHIGPFDIEWSTEDAPGTLQNNAPLPIATLPLPNPITEMQKREETLERTPELPAPPPTTPERHESGEHLVLETRTLSPGEIKKLVQALAQQDEETLKTQKVYPAYLEFLQKELHEIIKAPSAYTSIAGKKKQLEQTVHKLSQKKKISPLTIKGKKVASLTDAVRALERTRDAEFGQVKKDLASWVSKESEKKQLASQLYQAKTRREALLKLKEENKNDAKENRKKKREVRHVQQAISILEEEEKILGQFNIPLFFKLHKATSLESMLRLLKTIEYVYKLDLDTIIMLSKNDFSKWMKQYLALEKKRQDTTVLQVKNELGQVLNQSMEKMKSDLGLMLDDIKKKEAAAAQAIEQAQQHYANLLAEKERLDAVVNQRVENITSSIRKEQAHTTAMYEAKYAAFLKEREAFFRLKHQQDLEVFSELQRVEKQKKAVEAERFMLEEDKAEFEAARNAFQGEKKSILDSQKIELARVRNEWKMLTEKTATEKKKLDNLHKEYGEKIKRSVLEETKDLEQSRRTFTLYKEKEEERLKREQAILIQERLDLEALRKEIDLQEDRVKALLEAQKSEIKSDVAEMRKIDLNLERMESMLREERGRLEKDGVEKFIHARLTDIHPPSPAQAMPAPGEDVPTLEHQNLFDRIAECRMLLNQKNLQGARTLYEDIKAKSQKLNVHHRSEIQTLIKELYADITLSSIKQ